MKSGSVAKATLAAFISPLSVLMAAQGGDRVTRKVRASVEATVECSPKLANGMPLLVAAWVERLEAGRLVAGGQYNGKIDAPRLASRPLSPAEALAIGEHMTVMPTASGIGAPPGGMASETLVVQERALPVPKSARNVAWFQFDELCARPLAAADYLAIAERFAAVILEGIPRLEPGQRNEARRFHILIDALYEARTLFIASAAVPPEEIYPEGDGAWEFHRTLSRLCEMQSEDYIANRAAR